jgi:bla regulator protein blaR1
LDAALNWLLQGGLVALTTAALLQVVGASRSRARYAVLWVALIAVLVLPAIPGLRALASTGTAAARVPPSSVAVVSIPAHWSVSTEVVLLLWAAWFCVSAARVVRAGFALRHAKRTCADFPAARESSLTAWSRVRKNGRPSRLMLSSRVQAAAVLGCGHPVIAIAPPLVDQLTEAELDRVTIHEWAHVQRRDDLANLAQLAVRTIVGWHPAVWWLDRQLHLEREVACDEVAVALTGSAKEYASCLVRLATLPTVAVPPLPALAAASRSGLRRRIVRILAPGDAERPRAWRASALAVGSLLAAVAVAIGGLQFVVVDVAAMASMVSGQSYDSRSIAPAAIDSPSSSIPVDPLHAASAARRRVVNAPAPAPGAQAIRAPLMAPDARSQADARPQADEEAAPAALASLSYTTISLGAPPYLTPSSATTPAAATPWGAAADAGVAVGRGSQKAAVATAGYFSRFGKKIAASF